MPRPGGRIWLALATLIAALAALASCGGPLPPEDPFYLGSAKDDLSRGNHWYLRGCTREAARFYGEALTDARLSDSVPHIVMALNALGAARLAQGDLAAAAGLLDEAAGLSRSDPSNPELSAVLGNLGTLAWRAGRHEDALAFWEDAAARATGRGENPSVYLASIARAALPGGRGPGGTPRPSGASGSPEAFAAALERATASLELPGASESARADIRNLQARDALMRGDSSQARVWLNEALEIDRRLESQGALAEDLELEAELASDGGDSSGAAASLERAFYLRAALEDREGMRRILEALKTTARDGGIARDLAPLEAVMRDPALFSPFESRCP
ncbi:MAG: tetratricopeptide repeat protein [Deltaproteobacteria bacterium]|nr:tetratricopeptide repeat protein [Deltaproteobacteria bacterium]